MIAESINTFIRFLTSHIPVEVIMLTLFIAFLWVLKKVFNIFFGALKVIIASATFPLFLNKVLKIAVPLTKQSFLYYINLGLVLYILYLFIRSSVTIGNFLGSIFGRRKK